VQPSGQDPPRMASAVVCAVVTGVSAYGVALPSRREISHLSKPNTAVGAKPP